MYRKLLISFLLVFLMRDSTEDEFQLVQSRKSPPTDQSPSCMYNSTANEIDCRYLQADDMALLQQSLQETAQFVGSFGIFIEYSDGPNIPYDVFAGINLTHVSLAFNDFDEIPYQLLSSITSPLYGIYIADENYFSEQASASTWFLPFSEYLHDYQIVYTNIQAIDLAAFSQYSSLKRLCFYQNLIGRIGLELIQLYDLQELQLQDNDIVSIETGAFRDLKNLQILYLDNNKLSSLQEGAFRGLENSTITTIGLSGNPFNCDCDLQWLKDWLNARDLAVSSGARCAYPTEGTFNDVVFC